nr:DUF6504 family protein [Chelativorans petroleitrophicus]
MVVSHRERNVQRIAALDEQAEALGLKPGLGVADARAMHPQIEIVEADPEANRRLLESLADWCDRYTPLVAIDGSDGLFLDITGCVHLFGGEEKMMQDILSRLSRQGFDARAGLASSAGAAWAAARFPGLARILPGQEADALSPLPLSALRIDAETRIRLESVGLHTIGAILHAPRAPLARRFGAGLLVRLDQALGQAEEAISPRLPVPPLSAERQLVEPVVHAEDIENLVHGLAGTLQQDLERRGEGADVVQLSLFRVDGAVQRHVVRATLPLREPNLIRRLFRERFSASRDEIDAGYGFELVRLSVLKASPFTVVQTDLAGDGMVAEESLALFADRVRARLGEHVLMRPVPVESHIPERAVRMLPFAAGGKAALPEAAVPAGGTSGVPERPIRLFLHPEPIEVAAAEVPDGPPLNFRWRRAIYNVSRAQGPERIAPEWWHDDQEDAPTRDYFRVEDTEGRRFWLYRQGLYGAVEEMPRWFMHGIFP